MSILTNSLITVTGVIAAAYVAGQFSTKEIITEVEIDARPAEAWAVLTDLEDHTDWNPLIRSIRGDLAVGNLLDLKIELPGMSPTGFRPEVLVASENEELRWVGRTGIRGVFDGEHYFIFEETAQGTTRFRHGERFSGMLVYPVMAMIGAKTRNGFEAMNAAFKATVEARA